jgi:hypothetical protein
MYEKGASKKKPSQETTCLKYRPGQLKIGITLLEAVLLPDVGKQVLA